jgi:hypothetical protein
MSHRKFMEADLQVQRHEIRRSAVVSVLGTAIPVLQGEMLNISEGGTQIRLDQPLPYGSLVRIEYDDDLLLGEMVYCQQEESGWRIGIRVEHTLQGLKALAYGG